MKLAQLNQENNCSPDIGLLPNSVTNQSEKPLIKSATKAVSSRTRKLLRFLAAIRSSRPAIDRNCTQTLYYKVLYFVNLNPLPRDHLRALGLQPRISGSSSILFTVTVSEH